MQDSAANPASETPGATPPGPAAPAAAPVAPVARTIGERLRAGRERSGLSIPAAAEKLHLDPKVIEALEADRFAELGASVYVRGHLKRYGDFVGEPGAELVAMYSNREARATAPDLTQVPQAERRADPRALKKPLVALGSAAALLAAIWWVLAGSRPAGEDSSARNTPVVPGDAAPVLDAPAVTASPASLGSVTPSMTAGAPSASSPAASATPAVVAPQSNSAQAPSMQAGAAQTPPAAAPPRDVQLRLELASESWVEVFDARGERLYADVASAGSVQNLTGRGPLRVYLGNAAGVAVEVDGQRREIPDAAAEGEGARFVVNRSGSLSRAR